MPGPLLPYITLPELPLTFLLHVPGLGGLFDPEQPPSIKPFGALVATGVWVGSIVVAKRAKERGLDERKMSDFVFWAISGGFIGGHVLDALWYHPAQVAEDPAYLFRLWDGLSSYGGFTGTLIGALLYKWLKREPILAFCEIVASAFPLAWIFGRAGCTVVHDHPGRLSDAWYAVAYPGPHGTSAGRFDLGLYELLLTIPLALLFWRLWGRRRWPDGYFLGLLCALYAPFRFFLDFLRAPEGSLHGADPRYGGLTPAQWGSILLCMAGLVLVRRVLRRAPAVEAVLAVTPRTGEHVQATESPADPGP